MQNSLFERYCSRTQVLKPPTLLCICFSPCKMVELRSIGPLLKILNYSPLLCMCFSYMQNGRAEEYCSPSQDFKLLHPTLHMFFSMQNGRAEEYCSLLKILNYSPLLCMCFSSMQNGPTERYCFPSQDFKLLSPTVPVFFLHAKWSS
jgi:hypothetical protein